MMTASKNHNATEEDGNQGIVGKEIWRSAPQLPPPQWLHAC